MIARCLTITIGEDVAAIGQRAFNFATRLIEINFNVISYSDLVEKNMAFTHAEKDSEGLVVNIGDKVKRIPNYLFAPNTEQFPNIVSINFTSNSMCESIEQYAVYDCRLLTSLTLSKNLVSIGKNAFNNCNKLATIYYYATNDDWKQIAMDDGNNALMQAKLVCQ